MSIPAWARVGAKVVCVGAPWRRGQRLSIWRWVALLFAGLPVAGGVYVITEVGTHSSSRGVGICLKGWGDLGFHTDYFRPLITQQDDIETHFRALLDAPQSVEVA